MAEEERFLRLAEVMSRTGLGSSSIYKLANQGKFPRSVKLTDYAVGWVESEIAEWIDQRIAERKALAERKAQRSKQSPK